VRKLEKSVLYRGRVLSALVLFVLLNLTGCPSNPGQTVPPEDERTQISDQGATADTPEDVPEQQLAFSEGPTIISAKHSPLYNPKPHSSVITASASNTVDGIAKITIHAIKGTMTDCSELGESPSVIPCRKDASPMLDQECPMADPLNPDGCTMSIEIADGDMITYFAVATPVTGPDVTTAAITYGGGQPAAQVAVPVWWHTDMPNATLDAARINLAIYIDADFGGDLGKFGERLSFIVDKAFFNDYSPFADQFLRNRDYFDIWAFPFPGATADDSDDCDHKFIDNAYILDALMHGSAVLHKTTFTDCASIGTGGVGSISAFAPKPPWLLVHESGHFLFGLADEYGDGGQVPASDPHNVFATLTDCEAAAPFVGATKFDCRSFGWVVPTYRIRTDGPETMRSQDYTSEFRNSSAAAFMNRIGKCAAGDCYETP
jgi:hypothetical protein